MARLLPVWALLFSGVAYAWPGPFREISGSIPMLLGIVMFGMGMTLTPASFLDLARRPGLLALGVGLQFAIMPSFAFAIAHSLSLSPELAVGLILVGCCPGGTASNVICYLARADVALSIAITSTTTILAVLATPLLMELYAGRSVEVQVVNMILSIVRVVIIPVSVGIALNQYLAHKLDPLRNVFPVISVFAIAIIIAIVVAMSREQLPKLRGGLLVAVMLHNLSGIFAGYWVARLCGLTEDKRRTLGVEVGMQNSGLGVALALEFFSPLAALPGALASVWHILSGSSLAAYWAAKPSPRATEPD